MAASSTGGDSPPRSTRANANVGSAPVVGHAVTQTSCPCVSAVLAIKRHVHLTVGSLPVNHRDTENTKTHRDLFSC